MTAKTMKWARLGDYIRELDERNGSERYGLESVRGISIDKTFIDTKANMEGVSLIPYKVVDPSYFAYASVTSRNGGKISLAFNRSQDSYIVSSSYVVFRTTEDLLPEYLYLLLSRSSFDEYARFNSWGSARETFDWSELCRTEIPLPSLAIQRELVATYTGLKELAESNEALIGPLTEACQAFIIDCKRKWPAVPLGEYIREVDERNGRGEITLSQGIANTKVFQDPKQIAENSRADKIVRRGEFAYNRATTRNGEKISIAYREGDDCTVSSAYCVFKISREKDLDSHYLMLLFTRSEFDRYARYVSKGSAHEFFDWSELCRTEIPLPPLEVQHSIVRVYECLEESRRIAREAREAMSELVPALVQRAIHS